MAIGCIQAQKCHTDHCPVGVATQNPRYTFGLDVELKSVRAANYVRSLRRDLLKVSEAVGRGAPGPDHAVGHRHPRRPALGASRCTRSTATSDDWGAIGADAARHDRADDDVAGRGAAAAPDDALRPTAVDRRRAAGPTAASAAAGGPHRLVVLGPPGGELVEERPAQAATSCSTTVLRIALIRRVGLASARRGTRRAAPA